MNFQKQAHLGPSPLLAIAPGPTQVLQSSLALPWQGILLEKHLCSSGERTSASIDSHVVSLFGGAPSRVQYRGLSGRFIPFLGRPGAIMLTPAGPVPDMKLDTPSEFLHCALDDSLVRSVSDELDRSAPTPVFHGGIQDKAMQRILASLMEELEAHSPSGRLYIDSLAHALASRYLLFAYDSKRRFEPGAPSLVPRILNRVRDKIEANLDAELSLESLAEESGYSRAHFLRMFRAATGKTPHQYVLDLRLKKAQEALRKKGSSIIDVAVSCGFSSQSHMTSVFRQRLDMTPGEFRRNA